VCERERERESEKHSDHHSIRSDYFSRLQKLDPNFIALPNSEKLIHILGENSSSITTAENHVTACHNLRESTSGQN